MMKFHKGDIYEQDFIDFLVKQERKGDLYARKIQRWYSKRLYKPTSPYILRMVDSWQNE